MPPSRGPNRLTRIVAPALRSKRNVILPATALAVVALLAAAGPALAAATFAPVDGASPNQDKIKTLYEITGAMGLVILIIVEALIIYCIFKFRRRRGDPLPLVLHDTPLLVGWWAGA